MSCALVWWSMPRSGVPGVPRSIPQVPCRCRAAGPRRTSHPRGGPSGKRRRRGRCAATPDRPPHGLRPAQSRRSGWSGPLQGLPPRSPPAPCRGMLPLVRTTTKSALERRCRNVWAAVLRGWPMSRTAAWTRVAVSEDTLPGLCSARLTVTVETPATQATSSMVGRCSIGRVGSGRVAKGWHGNAAMTCTRLCQALHKGDWQSRGPLDGGEAGKVHAPSDAM